MKTISCRHFSENLSTCLYLRMQLTQRKYTMRYPQLTLKNVRIVNEIRHVRFIMPTATGHYLEHVVGLIDIELGFIKPQFKRYHDCFKEMLNHNLQFLKSKLKTSPSTAANRFLCSWREIKTWLRGSSNTADQTLEHN